MIQRIPKSNILPHPTKYLEQFFPMETLHSTPKIIQVRRISQNNAIGIVTQVHKVDITEGASAHQVIFYRLPLRFHSMLSRI